MVSSKPEIIKGKELGTGVTISDVRRVRDTVLDNQIRKFTQMQNSNDYKASLLGSIESLMSEPSDDGLSNLIKKFYNSWDELAIDPSSSAARTNVVNSAQRLSNKLSTVYNGIGRLKKDLRDDATTSVDEINSLLKNLTEVNRQIYDAHIKGEQPNTWLDKRDEILEQLSEYVDTNVHIGEDDTATVSIGGVFVANKTTYNELSVKVVSDNGEQQLEVYAGDENTKLHLQGGKLYGIVNGYNELINDYLKRLDKIGETIMTSVNSVHSNNYNLEDPPQTGVNFFSNYSAGQLTINPEIENDPNKIAISSDGTPENNDGALAIAELASEDLIEGETIGNYYSLMVSDIATGRKNSENEAANYEMVVQQFQAQRSEESAVNVDEEMVNVLNFQRSYDAAARLIKVADEMLQTLINMV
jgi:flagellar hook-associated protein 1 FlgK